MKYKIPCITILFLITLFTTSCHTEEIADVILTQMESDSGQEGSEQHQNIFYEEYSQALDESLVTYYYYDRLIGPEKELYCILYNGIMDLADRIHIPDHIEYDIVNRILGYVIADHPQIFWFHEYTMLDILGEHYFYPVYLMSKEEIDHFNTQCDRFMGDMFEIIDDRESQYSISKQAYDYIVSNVTYAEDANAQNLLSAMLNRRSVCTGFAKLYQYVLHKFGIESATVTGLTGDGTYHMWNLVKLDEEYYYTDLTYGRVNSMDMINYDYFNVTTDAITKIYEFEAGQILEPCTATAANYYTNTGHIFSEVDEKELKLSFDHGLPIAIRCTSREVYEEMVEHLITNKGIHDYFPGREVGYRTFDEMYKIEFF